MFGFSGSESNSPSRPSMKYASVQSVTKPAVVTLNRAAPIEPHASAFENNHTEPSEGCWTTTSLLALVGMNATFVCDQVPLAWRSATRCPWGPVEPCWCHERATLPSASAAIAPGRLSPSPKDRDSASTAEEGSGVPVSAYRRTVRGPPPENTYRSLPAHAK